MDQDKDSNQANELTANDILLVALELFTRKGYYKTALTDIAAALALPDTLPVYQHFNDKQSMAVQLYDTILDSLSVSIDEIRRKNEKPSEQLRGIVDLLFSLTDEAPAVMRFLCVLKHDEFLPEITPLHQTAAFVKINKIIQAGIKAGEIRSLDANLISAQFFGIILGTLRAVLNAELDKKADVYLSQTWIAAWNVVAKKVFIASN
jgi:AcrR family transcriptional regulator